MSSRAAFSEPREETISNPAVPDSAPRPRRRSAHAGPLRLTTHNVEEDASQRQAELFYLQKQIHSQTPMVVVLEDGERIEGCIEWYDRHCIKLRGATRTLIYKSAMKYMYKLGDAGERSRD